MGLIMNNAVNLTFKIGFYGNNITPVPLGNYLIL